MWKPLPNIHVLKTLRENSKEEVQRGQYLLAVGLGCYKWYQSPISGGVLVKTLAPKTSGLKGSPKEKVQRGQYLLQWAVGGCYKGSASPWRCFILSLPFLLTTLTIRNGKD